MPFLVAGSLRGKLLGAAALAIVCVAALLLVLARARHVVIDATAQMNRAVAALDTLSEAKAEGRLIPIRLRELQLADDSESVRPLAEALVLYGNHTAARLDAARMLVDAEMREILTATADDLSLLIGGAVLLAELRREMLETRDRTVLEEGEALERRIARTSRQLHSLADWERDAADVQAAALQRLAFELRLSGGRVMAGWRRGAQTRAAGAAAELAEIRTQLEALPASAQRGDLQAIAHEMAGQVERFQRLVDLVETVARVDADLLMPRRMAYEAALDRVFQRQRETYADALAHLEQATTRSKMQLAALAIAITTMIGGLFWILNRTVAQPLLRITDTLLDLAAGKRDVAVPHAQRGDEIGALARAAASFRGALVEVENARTRVEQALVTEREAHEQRKRFVSIASHEFRTPLAVIDSTAQRLLQARTPESITARADRIRTAVARMVQLIDRTLYAARLENGRIALNLAEVDLRELLNGAVRRQREIRRDFTIELRQGDAPLPVNGDAQMLEQVFQNLLSNAVKYSGRATRIAVTAERVDDDAVLRFVDHGIGIPPEEMPMLFQRFFRASTAKGIAGTGIGLNFVKDLVEMHGGSIAVESALGNGSTFTVRLPLARAAQASGPQALSAA